MKNQAFEKIAVSDINLSGIHKDLLFRQGEGLTKHIGEVFDDLSDQSAWLGGNGESWERGPYYIDGLIPLAYLLGDQELIGKAKKWVDSIIDSQDESGFFGPKSNHDWWPRAVVLKAMTSYYLSTKDERVVTFLDKYFKYLNEKIDEEPFEFWGFARGLEGMEAIDMMKTIGKFSDFESLEEKLKENTIDWSSFFEAFPHEQPTNEYINKRFFNAIKPFLVYFDNKAKKRKTPSIKDKEVILKDRESYKKLVYLTTHGVNIAMALKYLIYMEEDKKLGEHMLFEALDTVLKYHGNALKLFSSDEHLNGTSPDTGVELCTVVEMMYTMEEAMRLSGSHKAADYLEYYAYNALLSTISKDFNSHQYVQQVNQQDCKVKKHNFYDANKYANTFGVTPNYGCCAANMHQGWPKFIGSAVMKSNDKVHMFLYASGTYEVNFDDGSIVLKVETNYPFTNHVTISCVKTTQKKAFDIELRIPYQAKTKIVVNEVLDHIEGHDTYLVKDFKLGHIIDMAFDFKIETIINPDQSISVRKGPLVFAQELKSKEFHIKGKAPFHDRGYAPLEKSQLVPVLKDQQVIVNSTNFEYVGDEFFENTVRIFIEGEEPKTKIRNDITLVPYGLTILRKTQFKV